jgi:hypothetical protein
MLASSAPDFRDRQQHRLNYTTEKPFSERNSSEIYMSRRGTLFPLHRKISGVKPRKNARVLLNGGALRDVMSLRGD